MNINIKITGDVTHKIDSSGGLTPADLKALGDLIMSVLSDKIDAATKSVDAAITRVQTDVEKLSTKITELEKTVAAGTATPEDLAALDALKAKVDALDPTTPTVLPT